MENGKALVNIERVRIVTIEATPKTYDFDTATEAEMAPAISEGNETVLRVKDKILASDKREDITYGYDLTLNDSVLIPKVLAVVDGGTLRHETDEASPVVGYDAPAIGTPVSRTKFNLEVYTAEKDADGETIKFAKLVFPKCKGKPVGFSLKDGEFIVPKFEVRSRPATGEKPYTLDFVDTLPA